MPNALSDQERKVVEFASEGYTDLRIGKELDIRSSSVQTYWKRIKTKLAASNKAQCVAIYLRFRYQERIDELTAELVKARAHNLVTHAIDEGA